MSIVVRFTRRCSATAYSCRRPGWVVGSAGPAGAANCPAGPNVTAPVTTLLMDKVLRCRYMLLCRISLEHWSCYTRRAGSKIAVSLVGRHREPTSEQSYAFALSPSHPRVGRLGRSPLVHMQPPCQCSIRLVGCPVLRSGTSGAGICTVVCFIFVISRTSVASILKFCGISRLRYCAYTGIGRAACTSFSRS